MLTIQDIWNRFTSRKALIAIAFVAAMIWVVKGEDVDKLVQAVAAASGAAVAIGYGISNVLEGRNGKPTE